MQISIFIIIHLQAIEQLNFIIFIMKDMSEYPQLTLTVAYMV